ncbi:hypothetical protein EVAR_22202_1 [Eumeta japonica]|uniref:Uncharacterized protein n=1 Tax=Eumeta variegata TaxID=151549 RepID=A0A4C1UAA5_EUMVA|nr:hypothetical protein EVAR_22202_1 [Eumeta japonica]
MAVEAEEAGMAVESGWSGRRPREAEKGNSGAESGSEGGGCWRQWSRYGRQRIGDARRRMERIEVMRYLLADGGSSDAHGAAADRDGSPLFAMDRGEPMVRIDEPSYLRMEVGDRIEASGLEWIEKYRPQPWIGEAMPICHDSGSGSAASTAKRIEERGPWSR